MGDNQSDEEKSKNRKNTESNPNVTQFTDAFSLPNDVKIEGNKIIHTVEITDEELERLRTGGKITGVKGLQGEIVKGRQYPYLGVSDINNAGYREIDAFTLPPFFPQRVELYAWVEDNRITELFVSGCLDNTFFNRLHIWMDIETKEIRRYSSKDTKSYDSKPFYDALINVAMSVSDATKKSQIPHSAAQSQKPSKEEIELEINRSYKKSQLLLYLIGIALMFVLILIESETSGVEYGFESDLMIGALVVGLTTGWILGKIYRPINKFRVYRKYSS